MQKKLLLSLIVAALSGSAVAGERESMEALRATTLNLINALVEQGVLPKAKADALIKEAEAKAAVTTAANAPATDGTPPVVRVQYIPEAVKSEIREQLKREVLAQARTERWGEPGSLPDWINRVNWEGDLRLRFQQDVFQKDNAHWLTTTVAAGYFDYQKWNQSVKSAKSIAAAIDPGNFLYLSPTGTAAQDAHDSYKVRARLKMNAKISDDVSAGFRITTGSTTSPLSTNQSLGTGLNKYSLVLDQAYLKANLTSWLTVSGGRIGNPWLGTELLWANDLGFEGATATVRPAGYSDLTPWVTVGAFPLQDLGTSKRNKWLYGTQAGLDWNLDTNSTARIALGLFDYKNTHCIPNKANASQDPTNAEFNTDYTAPQFMQKGNSICNIRTANNYAYDVANNSGVYNQLYGLAADYRELNLTATVDLAHFDPVHVWATADVVRNIGFKRQAILARTGLDIVPRVKGYLGKVAVGMPELKSAGDWQFQVGYRYLEKDAVIDAYTDSDFHLGGTDAKGYTLYGAYALDKNTVLGLKWMSANEIHDLPLHIDVLQTDLSVRF